MTRSNVKGSFGLSIPLWINTLQHYAAFGPIEENHRCLEQTMNHISEEYSTARPLLNTSQVNNPLSSCYISYVPLPFICVVFSPHCVSISTPYCLLWYLSVEQLYHLIVASFSFWQCPAKRTPVSHSSLAHSIIGYPNKERKTQFVFRTTSVMREEKRERGGGGGCRERRRRGC